MQVRASHAASRTRSTQALAGIEHITGLDVAGAQVAHHAQEPAAVVQPDGVAVEEIVSGVDDAADSAASTESTNAVISVEGVRHRLRQCRR